MEDDDKRLSRFITVIAVVLVVGALLWVFVIQPAVAWVKAHAVVVGATFGSVAALALFAMVTYYILRAGRENRDREAQRAYEAKQREKGLVKYVDVSGKTRWGKPEEAQENRRLTQVVRAIQGFEPGLHHNTEAGYHGELYQWLKANFPSTVIEQQIGPSRPDIVVGDIAIEVKGPTGPGDLKTLADKYLKYKRHWNSLVVVLFEVYASHMHYEDIKTSLEEEGVIVIRK